MDEVAMAMLSSTILSHGQCSVRSLKEKPATHVNCDVKAA